MRGGERVLEAICELVPHATLFTLLNVPGKVSPTIARHELRTSFIQRMPRAERYYRYYLPLFPARRRAASTWTATTSFSAPATASPNP